MSSVAMVFTPAAPMAKSIVTPVASPDNSSTIGGVSSGSSAMKAT